MSADSVTCSGFREKLHCLRKGSSNSRSLSLTAGHKQVSISTASLFMVHSVQNQICGYLSTVLPAGKFAVHTFKNEERPELGKLNF